MGGRGGYRPLNYWVYDHEIFTRYQALWGDSKSEKNFEKEALKSETLKSSTSTMYFYLFRGINFRVIEIIKRHKKFPKF